MRTVLVLSRFLRGPLSFCLVLGLAGCVRDQPYQLHAPAPPATLANSQELREPSPKLPVAIPQNPLEDRSANPNVVTLEFSEKGRLFGDSCDAFLHGVGANCQVRRALKYIGEVEAATPAETRLVLLTYVHGNHHNASWSSSNFRNFQQLISCLNLGAFEAKRQWKDISTPNEDFACGHTQPAEGVRYLGLYVGWRGEAIRPTAKVTNAAVISRFHAAQRIATGPDLLPALRLVRSEAAKGPHPPQTLRLGHSYGGLLVSRLTAQSMDQALAQTTGPSVCGTEFLRSTMLADFTVVINTADDALHMAELAARWKAARASCPTASALPAPAMLSLFTPSDSDTRVLLTILLNLGDTDAIFSARAFIANTNKQDSLGDRPPTFENLRTNAFNKFDYFHNACYLDQHRGGDAACVDVNELILAAKKRAYRKVTTDLQAQVDAGAVTPFYNNVDVYSNGAWELLSSICYEPYEHPREPDAPQSEPQSAFPDPPSAVSCEADQNRRQLRQKLAAEFHASLRPFLAFPNAPAGPADDVLLDLYRRAEYDCSSQDVTADKACAISHAAWNNTPFWSMDISYENIQKHSGFWNADVFGLLLAMMNASVPGPHTSSM